MKKPTKQQLLRAQRAYWQLKARALSAAIGYDMADTRTPLEAEQVAAHQARADRARRRAVQLGLRRLSAAQQDQLVAVLQDLTEELCRRGGTVYANQLTGKAAALHALVLGAPPARPS